MKNLYICGCSHSTGFYWPDQTRIGKKYNVPYTVLLAEKLSLNPVMLANPGSSNYFIIKQIEFALKQGAEYIIFNITDSRRFDWVLSGKLLSQPPDHENFISTYNEKNFNANIISAPVDSLILHGFTELGTLLKKYLDFEMKFDQEKFMIEGIYSMLEKKQVRYISVNCNFTPGRFSDIEVLINSDLWRENLLRNLEVDDNHLNQQGHNNLAELIYSKVCDTFVK